MMTRNSKNNNEKSHKYQKQTRRLGVNGYITELHKISAHAEHGAAATVKSCFVTRR